MEFETLDVAPRRLQGKQMSCEYEQSISNEDEILKSIKEKKMKELMSQRKEKLNMGEKPVQVADADFDKTVHEHPLAVIDCWAPWCGPCRAMAPIIDDLAKEYVGKIFFGKLDVDENPKTAGSFQVSSIPTLLIMKGGCEIDRIIGLCPKEHIAAKLEKQLR